MTPLRRQMIQAMRQRGFSPRTHESYLMAVRQLAGYYHCSPDRLSTDQLQGFFDYLVQERGLAPASCRLYLHGIRFLYLQVLRREFEVALIVPRRQQRIPQLLTREEVRAILASLENPKHRMLSMLCYGCGLRVSELVRVRVRDIDGERSLLRIEQGKGAQDRLVLIGPVLLDRLRMYWQRFRPVEWFFPNRRDPTHPIAITTAQKIYQRARAKAGVDKVGGIHSLRHAYATHQLEAGLPVHRLQRLLGHRNLQSTLRYIHWLPDPRNGAHSDLIGSLGVDHA